MRTRLDTAAGLDESTRGYVERLEAMYDEQRLPSGEGSSSANTLFGAAGDDAGAVDAQALRRLHQAELDRVPVEPRQVVQPPQARARRPPRP